MSYLNDEPEALWNYLSDWSQRTFGRDQERGPIGPLKHLQKEAQEAIDNPRDIMEYADCLILVFDASRRAGFELHELFNAANMKLQQNAQRTYPKPATDEPSEHLK